MSDRADWLDLWAAFGFSNKDAAENRGASRTQLKLAVDVGDERLDIDAAVQDGVLREEIEMDRYGVEKRTRYRLAGVGQ